MKKPRVGIGLVLLLLAGINIVSWRKADLQNGGEVVGYFGLVAVFIGLGLWFILRGRGAVSK